MWHCPSDIVEDGCSVWPKASHGFDGRLVAGKRPLAAHELIVGLPGAFLAMAGGAFRRVHGFTLLWGPAAWRPTNAVWPNTDVPRGNFLRSCHPSELWAFSGECSDRSCDKT